MVFLTPSDRSLENLARASRVHTRVDYYRPFRTPGRVNIPHQHRDLRSWLLWRTLLSLARMKPQQALPASTPPGSCCGHQKRCSSLSALRCECGMRMANRVGLHAPGLRACVEHTAFCQEWRHWLCRRPSSFSDRRGGLGPRQAMSIR